MTRISANCARAAGRPNATHACTRAWRHDGAWGPYEAAIHRWEAIRGPAPTPVETGTKGQPRLAAPFVEWMMDAEPGWVTDVVPRAQAMMLLGNGVVRAQGVAAYRILAARAGIDALAVAS